ncbi:ABC-type phosphate/phosphonate transport system, permease component [Metamycoplasma cloacale]|uniref:ABC transporter permease n=1 Tax=Metamycoplasma cloacale TaxID=92401 RepID=A0A2Z4LME0_9BACT|nr:ABC transporter permease subunit [Metamycoplasma cloacale]AWX42952.1 ABC transporter permease [Metamycoplasma cloacale]VEU79224.1 ABC-type phosphate/phosphonate transport system, permease component [Metamycoplasma cloacale]
MDIRESKIQHVKSLWKETYSNSNTKIKGPIKKPFKIVAYLLTVILIILFLALMNFQFAPNGWSLFITNLKFFFQPRSHSLYFNNLNLWSLSIKFLFYSIKILFIGTFCGCILAFFTAFFSNRYINNKYLVWILKVIIIFLRLFPEIFFIYFFLNSFDKNLGLFLITTWFSWLWLHEYFVQIYENANYNTFFHFISIKKSKYSAFISEIWPQIKFKIINTAIYSFESNLRWSAILSQFGFLGIGTLLNTPILNSKYYAELMIPLFVLITFLFLIEIFQFLINNYLFKTITVKNGKQYHKQKSIKISIYVTLFILMVSLLSLGINELVNQKIYIGTQQEYIKQLFSPNWSIISFSNIKENNLFWILFEFVGLVSLTIVLIYILIWINLFFVNTKLNKKYTVFTTKLWNLILRTTPILILFIFIYPLFNNPATIFIFVFAIHGSSSTTRNLEETINSISDPKIESLSKQGWTKLKIYRNFILPSIKLDLITYFMFEVEKIARNFISYGIYSSSLLGSHMILNRVKDIDDIAPYLWISFFILSVIVLINYLWRHYAKNKYSKSKLIINNI